MRKFLTLVLLAIFGLPLVSPLLALGQDTGTAMHACCRRGGSHHCQETAAPAAGTSLSAEHMHCPYSPATAAVSNVDRIGLASSTSLPVPMASHPHGIAQAESLRRIARERTRQKRGPPASLAL